MNTNSPFLLTLLGKVSSKIINKLLKAKPSEKENCEWFFVDYSLKEIKKKTSFDVILQKGRKNFISRIYHY
jgi:hypothetical protein